MMSDRHETCRIDPVIFFNEPTATDAGGNVTLVLRSHQPGATFAPGNTTVVYIFEDLVGNDNSCTFTVIIVTGSHTYDLLIALNIY